MDKKADKSQKGEIALRKTFVAFSLLLFAFFLLDISLTTVAIGQTITAVINLIPLI